HASSNVTPSIDVRMSIRKGATVQSTAGCDGALLPRRDVLEPSGPGASDAIDIRLLLRRPRPFLLFRAVAEGGACRRGRIRVRPDARSGSRQLRRAGRWGSGAPAAAALAVL